MKKIPQHAGFTLIELLLYVALIGGLLTAVSYFYVSTVTARIKTQTITEVEQQGQAAMDVMLRSIRNSTSITTPAAGASSASLTLGMPIGATSPTVFDANAGALRIKEGSDPATTLTNSKVAISSLNFTNLTYAGTPGVIQVSFTLSRASTTNRMEYTYQKTFTGTAVLR